MTELLGELKSVDLRKIWKREDSDFTPWLAQESNLKLLADTIGIGLELEEREKGIGPFRADILCKNRDDDSWVLIENQLERADHKHLGQLLTYAAGLHAVTIIWIAEHFTDEHRAALDWLNENTDERLCFFGIKVELWKIGDSPPALKFNIISSPNNWSRSRNPTKKLLLRYWQTLVDYIHDKGSKLARRKPVPYPWYIFPIDIPPFHFAALIEIKKQRIGVELYIKGHKHSEHFYHLLKQDKEAIEQEIGASLEWMELPRSKKMEFKIVQFKDADPRNGDDWPNQHEWIKERVEAFDRVFRDRIRNLDPEQWEPEEDDI